MSRIRQEISSVQFQVDARKANASMEALQTKAKELNTQIEGVKSQIQALGNVAPDDANLIAYHKTLKQYERDLKDVTSAQRELVKGVKAADELFRQAQHGTIESLSVRSIKSGQRGLQARMQNLNPKDSEDAKTLRAYKAVIEEGDIVIKRFQTDAKYLIDTIKNGGSVSKDALTQAKQGLQDLVDATGRGTKKWEEYHAQLTTVEATLKSLSTAEARTSGKKILGQAFRGDFATADVQTIENIISKLKEYQRVIEDPEGKGARHFAATNAQIEKLQATLTTLKSGFTSVDEVLQRFNQHLGESKESHRMTNEQMQEGIKLLEREYASTEQNTTEGKKRREELRMAIDKMTEEIKTATGEWMSLADAQDMAEKAGGDGFFATTQQMQQATAALERHRDALIKTIRLKQADGAATDAEEKELKDLEVQLKKLKFEQDNFNMSHKRMEEILKAPKSAGDIETLRAAIKRADGELRRMEGALQTNTKQDEQMAKQVKEAKVQLAQLEGQAKGTASAFEKAWSRLKTYVGLYVGAAVAMQKLTSSFGDLMELSDKMGEVRKTTGFTADQVGRLTENLKKMDTRTSLVGLTELSAAAGQLGLKTEEDVQGFTEAANKLMVALPEMGREGATEMLKVALATGEIDKIRKKMEQGLIDGSSATAVAMEKVGSTIDRLRATSASTAPAITDFVKRVGAVGAQSGISIDQVAALGSTVDALGMRVEMSATALSRMMPAIKNNAFDIAQILGVTPNSIRELYDTGKGMEVILMILQRMKDQNMDADSIEKMLGMGGMQDIMKELNQQGARAGIVFGGLSQNVDELRRQLSVAAQAYKENIAIQQEYDKMNETTAAKWERLKNQVEEFFVGDTSQRVLGGIIDMLRFLVDVLTGGLGAALGWITPLVRAFITYWAVLKLGLGEALFIKATSGLMAMGKSLKLVMNNTKAYILLNRELSVALKQFAAASTFAEKRIIAQTIATKKAELAQKGFNKEMVANVWLAMAAAVMVLVYSLYKYFDSLREAGREAAKFQAELEKEQRKVNDLTNSIGKARVKIEEANKAVSKARAELDAAKKANDGTTDAVKRLTKAEADLLAKEEERKNAMATHKQLIEQFNSQYSKYLGFILSEVASNLELARARDLVNAKLAETITLKQREAGLARVEEKYGEGRDEAYSNIYTTVENTEAAKKDPTLLPRVMRSISGAATSSKNQEEFSTNVSSILKKNKVDPDFKSLIVLNSLDYYDEVQKVNKERNKITLQSQGALKENKNYSRGTFIGSTNAAIGNYNNLQKQYNKATGERRKELAAAMLSQMDTLDDIMSNASSYYDFSDSKQAASYNKNFRKTFLPWYNKRKSGRSSLLKEAGNYYTPRQKMVEAIGSGANGQFAPSGKYTTSAGGGNIWGGSPDAASTEYGTWNVNELVARRNQMDKFKNYLKDGVDVKAILAEDTALMKAIDSGKIGADWKSAMEWYNVERKKIEEELKSEKHSTDQGHWRNETETDKKGRKKTVRKNPLVESDYALAELDRYYSRRKETLEKARIEENMSEEAFNRQAELLEQEHLQKRSTLRATFTGQATKEETEAFRKWWQELVNQFELAGVQWDTVMSEWAKATNAMIGRNNLSMQKDLTDMQMITVKHMNQIAKIIAKERPYDTITDNLRKNLTDMGILFADMEKDGSVMDTSKVVQAQSRRMSALMAMAEDAYSLTNEDMLTRLRSQEYTRDWALAIEDDDTLTNALMAQLRKVYDEIQNAIQKEASLIKKHTEIIWKDAVPELGKKSRKDVFEGMMTQLGLDEDRLRRANELIGAGQASERVADKLAIKQMQIRLSMEEHYYNLMQAKGSQRIAMLMREMEAQKEKAKILNEQAEELKKQGKIDEANQKIREANNATQQSLQAKFDAQHAATSLNLSMSEEQKKIEEQRVEIANKLEESQNRLYKDLKEWSELLTSSIQNYFEATHAGDAEYYNERAKLSLTGKGGPGAGTYVIIDNEGTSDATAHYEYLDEREALERQHEIERQNAMAEAWKKIMDDINMKMSDMITDQINAMMQDAALDANSEAIRKNTEALEKLNAQSLEVIAENADDVKDAQKKDPVPLVTHGGIQNGHFVDENGNPIDKSGNTASQQDITAEEENTTATTDNTTSVTDNTGAVKELTAKLDEYGKAYVAAGGKAEDAAAAGDGSGSRAARKRAGEDVGANPYDYTQGVSEDNGAMQEPYTSATSYDEGQSEGAYKAPWQMTEDDKEKAIEDMGEMWQGYTNFAIGAQQTISDAISEIPGAVTPPYALTEEQMQTSAENAQRLAEIEMEASKKKTEAVIENNNKEKKNTKTKDGEETQSSQSKYAKMIQAANLYGIAYQTMSNDNLSASQKFQTFALQTAGQTAISMLTADWSKNAAEVEGSLPAILAKCLKVDPIVGAAIFAGLTALLGGLMGVAMSKVTKGKSQIAAATGASASAGRLATGMLTYAEGNVNEFTDPSSLTVGRKYNVDGADGRTYRARYMGKGAKTHITNGPEFHLVGEAGREAIIDAKTTRNIRLNEPEIWHSIQTLYNGGSLGVRRFTRRGRGVATFADGNLDELGEMGAMGDMGAAGMSAEQMAAFQTSLDRNNELLERALTQGIKGVFNVYGKDGLVDSYDTGKKTLNRYGQKY